MPRRDVIARSAPIQRRPLLVNGGSPNLEHFRAPIERIYAEYSQSPLGARTYTIRLSSVLRVLHFVGEKRSYPITYSVLDTSRTAWVHGTQGGSNRIYNFQEEQILTSSVTNQEY